MDAHCGRPSRAIAQVASECFGQAVITCSSWDKGDELVEFNALSL